MGRKRPTYDPDWDDPKTIARFLAEKPPTMRACAKLFEDMAEEAESPLHLAWFLAAAALLKSQAEGLASEPSIG